MFVEQRAAAGQHTPRRSERYAMPAWLRTVLLGGALWICVAMVRGITFALTQATHGM